jgi:hypothetical protein
MSNLSIEFIPRNSPRRGASGLPSHDLGEHLILDAEDDGRLDPWVVLHPWSGGSSLPLNQLTNLQYQGRSSPHEDAIQPPRKRKLASECLLHLWFKVVHGHRPPCENFSAHEFHVGKNIFARVAWSCYRAF